MPCLSSVSVWGSFRLRFPIDPPLQVLKLNFLTHHSISSFRKGAEVVEFKAIIADPKSGKSYPKDVSGHHANSLIGKKIGEEVDGIFVDLPGYKLVITGGSDRDGVPMRKDMPGSRRRPMLVTKGVGFHPKDKGVRKRRNLRGNTISPDIIQLNMRIVAHGPKPIKDSLEVKEGDK